MPKNIKQLEKKLHRLMKKFRGTPGIAFKNLKTKEELYIHADEPFATASTIKVPIMVEVFYQVKEKKIKLTDTLTHNRKTMVNGSGILQHLSDKLKIDIYDAMVMMITLSDNTTTNMLLDVLGVKNINQRMESLGFPHIKVFRKAYSKKAEVEPQLCKKYGFGMATPREMNELLELIYRKKIVDKGSCKEMMEILKKQFYETSIRRFIYGKGVWVANKTGSVTGVRNDVGIIHTPHSDWILSVYCKEVQDKIWRVDNEGNLFIANISRAIFDYYID